MDLNKGEVGWFIDQAVRGLLSFGFDDADAQFVNTTLSAVFNGRCAPATAVIPPSAGPQLQAICIAPDCPLAANDTCSAYPSDVAPSVANATLVGNYTKAADGTTSFNASSTTAGTSPTPTAAKSGAGVLAAQVAAAGAWAGLLALGLL